MTLMDLWVPMVVAAVVCFVASNLIWMVLRLHRGDWYRLPDEEAIADAFRAQNVTPGEYSLPFAGGPEEWKSPEWQARVERGPNALITVRPAGKAGMGKMMAAWVLYLVVVELFVAYLGSVTVAPGASFAEVFQVTGTAAILGFAGACAPQAIWFGRRWANVARDILDGLIYGLLSATIFAWLWPGM